MQTEKIKEVLKAGIAGSVCTHPPVFVYWVKKTKQFQLLSYDELNLTDVLYGSPVKEKVRSQSMF